MEVDVTIVLYFIVDALFNSLLEFALCLVVEKIYNSKDPCLKWNTFLYFRLCNAMRKVEDFNFPDHFTILFVIYFSPKMIMYVSNVPLLHN